MLFFVVMLGWPLAMVSWFLALHRGKLRSAAEFGVFAALMLYGISKLVSTEFLPFVIGLLPIDANTVLNELTFLHLCSQVLAAFAGAFLVERLARQLRIPRHERTTA